MLKVDTTDIEHLEDALTILNKKALPYAVKRALDATAWKAREHAQEIIGDEFVERNRWTRGSIRVEKARIEPIDRQHSAFGSVRDYMRVQEKGGVKKPQSGRRLPIPTSTAAGQAPTQKPRTRQVQQRKRMSAIRFRSRFKRWGGKAQAAIAAVNQATKKGDRFLYLELPSGTKGVFEVVGGSPSGRGWAQGSRLEMVADLSRASVRIPKHRWMRPAADKTRRGPTTIKAYRKALWYQIERKIKHKYGL